MWCIVLALALCATQVSGNTFAVLFCCVAYMGFIFMGCVHNFTLPIALFFLPWSPILRASPDSFSFYTVGLVMLGALNVVKNWNHFVRYQLVAGIFLVLITLFSKLVDGSYLAMDYLCFMLMIVVFPVFKLENAAKKYDFFGAVVFLAAGVVISALCAQQFASYGNIARYIRVHTFSTVIRRCGFYGDSNFYAAQITAALSGCLVMLLKVRSRGSSVALGFLVLMLLYCGFLSGSKSYILILCVLAFLWVIGLLKMRGRFGQKTMLIVFGVMATVYIATSSLFGGLIDVVLTRFSYASDLDSFTTGRTELWKAYFDEIINDWKTLFLGKGFTNVKVNGRASHNTIIQMIFQFGIIGTPVLVGWIVNFWRNINISEHTKKMSEIGALILIVGTFLPWIAIDALFFDEFFLFQWYCFMGIQALQPTFMSSGVHGLRKRSA